MCLCDKTELRSLSVHKYGDDSIHKEEIFNGLKKPTLSGHKLHLSTEFRYLRLILDKRLAWNTLLKKMMNRVYWAFCTCKSTFGKMWGLKPIVLCWIYAMVNQTHSDL
jgi:hypothetical protein